MEGLVVGPKLQVTHRYGKSSSLRHCHQLSQASGSLALALQEGIRRDSIQKGMGAGLFMATHHSGDGANPATSKLVLNFKGKAFKNGLYAWFT
jgi:hypothetical protein